MLLEKMYNESDSEVDEEKHANLIENVLNLDKVQHIKKPSRTEPTLQISEFNLVKSLSGAKGAVHVNDLTKVLKQRVSHVELGKKVRNTEKKSKTLRKPLEKPQADKIRRAVGYTKAKLELDKWEPIVTSNRASLNLRFPLKTDLNVTDVKNPDKFKWRIKTELEKKLEEAEEKIEEYVVEPDIKLPLTLNQIMERRKVAAKMRAHQSYQEAKARRQNKIKSKKFHRIQRREKMKQQLQEFELLQKEDPEEALKKLEEIEKARAEERMSLRHRSTGKWAKNKQIRAKYDKDSRQVLAQQLTLSRELTQKVKMDDDSDSEGEESQPNVLVETDPNNGWVDSIKTESEIDNFVKSYRKFWEEHNKNKKVGDNTESVIEEENTEKDSEDEMDDTSENNVKSNEERADVETEKNVGSSEEIKTNIDRDLKKQTPVRGNSKTKQDTQSKKKNAKNSETICDTKKNTKNSKKSKSTSQWQISDIKEETAIDNVFDNIQERLSSKLKRKASTVLKSKAAKQKKQTTQVKDNKTYKPDLSLPNQKNRPVIDESLDEKHDDNLENGIESNNNDTVGDLERILKSADETSKTDPHEKSIDKTNKVKNAKTVVLNSSLPDKTITVENESDDEPAGMTEAFEDSDLMNDFQKEKKQEIEKNKPKDIDLTLPGWGSWGGKDVKIPKRKSKRFMMKFPKRLPRRDDNKGKLIINEEANGKIKEHMVSQVPFPFKAVKDFEASIRAPIGRTFVPEPAFRKMVKPAVLTKMGAIIEPISDEVLFKKSNE